MSYCSIIICEFRLGWQSFLTFPQFCFHDKSIIFCLKLRLKFKHDVGSGLLPSSFLWKDPNPVYIPMMEPNPEYFSNDGSESWIFFNDGSESWIFSKGRIQILNTIHSVQRTDLNPEYFPKDVSEFEIFSKRRIRFCVFPKDGSESWIFSKVGSK